MEYIMYLRKSRADNPDETVEEVLSKHETILQEYCMREFGERIIEPNIYREVVSGESIDDREEIKKVLRRIEDSHNCGIVVVEPQRLSRGDLIDCGRLINTLQYTDTRVFTPTITYNLQNKMDRRFFQDELMRGRDYLEYTKEILMRGKLAAINRGCYLQSVPPFGYNRVKLGRDFSLEPNADADTVRLIFDMFVHGASTHELCKRLSDMGIPSPTGKAWTRATLDKIVRNQHYIGKITYQHDKSTILVEDGQKVEKRVRQKEGDYIVVPGKHAPIVSEDVFSKAQELISLRPPVKSGIYLKNALAGLLYCNKCGHIMVYKEKDGGNGYLCCKTVGCSKSIKYGKMLDTVADTLRRVTLPSLEERYRNGDGRSEELQKKLLHKLQQELAEMQEQEETQYELLETRKYTQEVFDRRNAALHERMNAVEAQIASCHRSLPRAVDYKEKIASLNDAIQSLCDPSVDERSKNLLLKSVLSRIDCTSNQTNRHDVIDLTLTVTLKV